MDSTQRADSAIADANPRRGFRPRSRVLSAAVVAAAIASALCMRSAPGHAAVRLPDGFVHEVIVSGLAQPAGMAFLRDGRLLVVEQKSGRIRLIADGALLDDPGTVPDVNGIGGERGLLGIAVDPGWPVRPYVYVHVTSLPAGSIRISRFTFTGDLPFASTGALSFDPLSRRDLIADIPDAASIHNGGTLRFGRDGMLYASLGEDAVKCAAQDSSTLRGVILRLDVTRLPGGPGPTDRGAITPVDNPFVDSTDPNRRLIWALGLRNPFRFHVDPADGALYVGDVGESAWEELDRIEGGGLNFGWPLFEAAAPTGLACPGPPQGPFAPPILAVPRIGGQPAAVITAGLYRVPSGAATPFPAAYDGDLFFADYYSGRLQRLQGARDVWTLAPPVPGQPSDEVWADGFAFVSDWLVGPDGALWCCRQGGSIERIAPGEAPPDTTPPAPRVTLAAPWPVPSSGRVDLAYNLPVAGRVAIDILDMNGRLVRRLLPPTVQDAGPRAEHWDGRDDDGRDARSGFYVVRLKAGSDVLTRRIVMVR